jgi:hypothetical protein
VDSSITLLLEARAGDGSAPNLLLASPPSVHRVEHWNDYANVLKPIVAKRCEMQARLFDAELQFPAFDFLKGDNSKLF